MERTCAQCGAKIPPQKGSARPRKYCVTCRPPRGRPNPRVIAFGVEQDAGEPNDEPEEPALVVAYRARLEGVDRVGTPEGQHVLFLASLLAAGGHTSSGAAALSKELRTAMDAALAGAPREADFMDELAERRAAKVAGAS